MKSCKNIICKYCGAKELWWLPLKRGEYRLMNKDGSYHICFKKSEQVL